jgi:hypothetical protein
LVDFSPEVNPLYYFNTLFDTDFGLIRLLSREYRADVFDLSALDLPDRALKWLLINRTEVNPLYAVLIDDLGEKDTMDLYLQFMDQRYEDILKLSPFTGIGELFVQSPLVLNDITPTVSFNNDLEKQYLKSFLESNGIKDFEYKEVDAENLNCSKYNPIVIKDCRELGLYRNYEAHVIYLCRYKFNVTAIDGQEIIDPARAILLNQCSVNIIDVYRGISTDYNTKKGRQDNE